MDFFRVFGVFRVHESAAILRERELVLAFLLRISAIFSLVFISVHSWVELNRPGFILPLSAFISVH
jgi:hypothetical protein